MTPAGFEPAIPASERRETHALDRAVTLGAPTGTHNRYNWSETRLCVSS